MFCCLTYDYPGECSVCTWENFIFCCILIEYSLYVWVFLSGLGYLSLLIWCLDGLFVDVSGVLKFPTITVLLSISPFRSVFIFFIYLGSPMLGA